jgi:hypothetical protein
VVDSHKHKFDDVLHEVIPPPHPTVETEEGSGVYERDETFEPPVGEVGYEMDVPYRVFYCACGEKKIVAMPDDEARQLMIVTGRITEEVLTNVGSNAQTGV